MKETMKRIAALLLVMALAIGTAQAIQGTTAKAASWKKVKEGSVQEYRNVKIGEYYYHITEKGFSFSKSPNASGTFVKLVKGKERYDEAVYVHGKYIYWVKYVIEKNTYYCKKFSVYRIKVGAKNPKKVLTVKTNSNKEYPMEYYPSISMFHGKYIYISVIHGHVSTQEFLRVPLSTGKTFHHDKLERTWGFLEKIKNSKSYALNVQSAAKNDHYLNLYNFKTGKTKKIVSGSVCAYLVVGKKIFYVTNDSANAGKENRKLMSCSMNGKNKKVLAKLKVSSWISIEKKNNNLMIHEGDTYTYTYNLTTGKLKKK